MFEAEVHVLQPVSPSRAVVHLPFDLVSLARAVQARAMARPGRILDSFMVDSEYGWKSRFQGGSTVDPYSDKVEK